MGAKLPFNEKNDATQKGIKTTQEETMKTRIYDKDLKEIMIESCYPVSFINPNGGIIERHMEANLSKGKGTYNELFFEGIHIGYGDMHLSQNLLIDIESEWETVELHFTLSGNTRTKPKNTSKEHVFSRNEQGIFFAKHFKGESEWSFQQEMKIFEINMQPDFFSKHLDQNSKFYESFQTKRQLTDNFLLGSHPLQISAEMHLLIQEILNSKRTGHFKRLLIEAKVIELLMLQLEALEDHHCRPICTLKKSEIDKIHQAKEILLEKLATPMTIHQLSMMVGTNAFTLKNGFRDLFGMTVFELWNRAKMLEAKRILLDTDKTVYEISEMVGYKNPQHFSTAFKKYFGVSPSKLKL